MSSPISHWSSSPESQKSATRDVLTPTRRVKALLAQFDNSDSEEESARPGQTNIVPESRDETPLTEKRSGSNQEGHDDDDEDEALLLAPRGRLAARLQAARSIELISVSGGEEDDGKAYERVREQMFPGKTTATQPNNAQRNTSSEGSEDELSRPNPRRILQNRKSSPVGEPPRRSTRSRSASPLLFSLPPALRRSPNSNQPLRQSESDSLPDKPGTSGTSKFLALVEKHRKQRLAKEAAEIAKKAARTELLKEQSSRGQGPRGSSPGNGSSEESDMSDGGSAKKLAQNARPGRNASKKAEEENRRAIQRMSRNMQLAHQARTRKKITKESLLAKFNYPMPKLTVVGQGQDAGNKSTTASSAPTSDVEGAKEHVTPPTSPLIGDSPEKPMDLELPAAMVLNHTIYNKANEELPSLEDVMMRPIPRLDKGKGKAVEVSLVPDIAEQRIKEVRPIRVKWSKQDAVLARSGDSDSDLEIITSRSKTRKYAAFESLPKRKAKETESHLTLRSLAHLMGNDNKQRSSMNSAEMEIFLRKAAREQARREREEKIEELKARGVVIQTAEERERDQQEIEDIVEQARQEAAEIQKREKALAKKDGTFEKDALGDDSDDERDGDFMDEDEGNESAGDSGTDGAEDEVETGDEDEDEEDAALDNDGDNLIDREAGEQASDEVSGEEDEDDVFDASDEDKEHHAITPALRKSRNTRVVISDDEYEGPDEDTSPGLSGPAKTPTSLPRSARKIIPGLQMSDDLPMGLTQAFAATMADSQTQDDDPATQEQISLDIVHDLPSPLLPFGQKLNRLDSVDMVSDSQPASQTQPMNVDLSFSQFQGVPQSPVVGLGITGPQFTPSQLPFDPTQDAGYMFSPFNGSRFDTETPKQNVPHSTVDTVILPHGGDESPVMQRKGRLRRGRNGNADEDDISELANQGESVFEVMRRAAKQKANEPVFDKTKSAARDIIDEAAEESEDEYAGLGGASDDSAGEEDEDDRKMIDEDTQIGRGDEAKLAGLFADRERKQDEAAVSKLLKDITTGALRRKRGVGDELDLSDEEDAAARRREAKRREFAKMRRELLKDEAVGKIAEDQKKEAFLRSIEDRDEVDDDEDDSGGQETPAEEDSQSQFLQIPTEETHDSIILDSQNDPNAGQKRKRPLEFATDSTLNRLPPAPRRTTAIPANKRPKTLAEIRESVSFLIDEPDSQAGSADLGLSDTEDELEAYVDLDRHLNTTDENPDDAEDLGDFIVDDGEANHFKKPELPRRSSERASYSERRTKQRANVVDRLQLLRQSSSSSASSTSSHGANGAKMAFFTNKAASTDNLFGKVPALLRRATTNSSFGNMAGRVEEVSATGVATSSSRTERGSVEQKEFIRKGSGGRRNTVNYSTTAAAIREKPADGMRRRAGVSKKSAAKGKKGGGFLGGLFRGDSWN